MDLLAIQEVSVSGRLDDQTKNHIGTVTYLKIPCEEWETNPSYIESSILRTSYGLFLGPGVSVFVHTLQTYSADFFRCHHAQGKADLFWG